MRLTEFLEPFFMPDEVIHGRAIKPKKSTTSLGAVKFEFTREQLSESAMQKYMIDLNRERGIYFVVNAGGASDDEICRFNAAFCEIDDRPIVDQHDLFDNAPLPPSIRVETKKSVHVYWLLDEIITPAEFTVLQKGLIKYFNSDAGIHNASRLMRLPFFNHIEMNERQAPEYKRVTLHSFSETRFSFAELNENYPFEFPKPVKQEKFNHFDANGKLDAARQELINRIEGTRKFRRLGSFGYTSGVCHDGQASDTALYVNYATGYVACFHGCDYSRIASALGVNFK